MAGADEFTALIDELKQTVGDGTCTGSLERDQAYAHYQHSRLDLKHPRGGRALYQEAVLQEKAPDYLQTIAGKVLDAGVDAGMADVVEQFDEDSGEACPKELTLLAHSGHPRVVSNGATVYDRAPEVPRLSEQELRSLHSVRASHRRRG